MPSYDMTRSIPRLFESWRAGHDQLPVKHIARATSAAPTFFPPKELIQVTGTARESHAFLDGGLYANNPAMAAFAKACYLWPDAKYIIVSIGTGYSWKSRAYEQVKHWGQTEWLDPLIYHMFQAGSISTHFYLSNLAAVPSPQITYYRRLNVRLPYHLEAMDNATNIKELSKTVRSLASEFVNEMGDIVRVLTNPTESESKEFRYEIQDELHPLEAPEKKSIRQYLATSMEKPRRTLYLQMLIIFPLSTMIFWHLDLCDIAAFDFFKYSSLPAIFLGLWSNSILLLVCHFVLLFFLQIHALHQFMTAAICTTVFGVVSLLYTQVPIAVIQKGFNKPLLRLGQGWQRTFLVFLQIIGTFVLGPLLIFSTLYLTYLATGTATTTRILEISTIVYWCCVVISRAVVHILTMKRSAISGQEKTSTAGVVIAPKR